MIGKFAALAFTYLMADASASGLFPTKPLQTSNKPKAKFMSKLLEKAEPTENSRKLDAVEVDISGYEIKFDKCQYVKAYDDELAEDEEMDTVLATKRFIIFRLCPSGSCESCAYNFGEYVIDMENYLMLATEYFVQDRENFCGLVNQVCEADDDAVKSLGLVDCDEDYAYCANIEAMEENGYVESYEFAECIQVWQSDDDGDDAIFAGAMCSNNGAAIKIGAFYDEDCSVYRSGVDIEDYMENGVMFNNEILEKVVDASSCVSCIMKEYEIPADDDAGNGEEEEVQVNELCENLYEMSAKCESKYGFDNYWKDEEEYYNQYLQEDLICDFIGSLESGNYDQYGEIVLSGSQTQGSAGSATGGQKFALVVFILSTIGLAVYAASLHSQITKGAKADLSAQGGAMA